MADIKEAVRLINEGYLVHRPGCMVDEFGEPEDAGMGAKEDGYLTHELSIEDILAFDWEIFDAGDGE